MKNRLSLLFLTIIIIFGFIVRIYQVANIPPGLFADEASIGYNAYTLLKFGTDETGIKLPFFFQNYGNFFRPGVSVYFSAPFIFLFGLKEFSLRLASVIIGTLTILAIFFLGKILFSSSKIGLLSALMLAISPWHIHFSRIGQEFIYLVLFLTVSLDFFLFGVLRQKPKFLILSFVLFGLTLYTYVPAYFLVPLFVVYLSLIFFKELRQNPKPILVGFFLLALTASPLLIGLTNQKTMSRFQQLRRTDEGKTQKEVIVKMLKTYKDHFMPEFLFKKGDIGYHSHFITRFSVRGMGQLYWFQLPLLLIGLFFAWRYKKSLAVLLGWLLFYPLGSTLFPFADGGGPFAMRSIIGVIPFQIISALGLVSFFSFIKNKFGRTIIILVCTIVIVFSFGYYLKLYFVKYPLDSADYWGWQSGPKEIIACFESVEQNYDNLYLSGDFNSPEVFIHFYSPTNCKKCQVGDLGKLNLARKQLFALRPTEIKIDYSKIIIRKNIKYPDGKTSFVIFEVKRN